MEGLYRSPLRVYLALLVLSAIGIWSAFQLPISLFPNSSKPGVKLCVGINLAPDTFLRVYGESIEAEIAAIRRPDLEVEKVVSAYTPHMACYDVDFKWGGSDDAAMREMLNIKAALLGRLPIDSRERVSVSSDRDNGGLLALSFYSSERSLGELYKLLEPALMPKLTQVHDALEPTLYNPQQRQIMIELKPEVLATFQLLPSDVSAAILASIESYTGGSLTQSGGVMTIEYPRPAVDFEGFKRLQVPVSGGRSVSLSQLANIDLTVPLDAARIIKTSGAPSVILFAQPKPGGNIKAMAEDMKAIVNDTLKGLPKDIQYKSLVDPSEFIQSAVSNVMREVALAAGLAVLILFLFVGNIKNVVTAAIEIPLSLVLAFILMRFSGMNLNLISLGGLALSAGMNVDASVVVMENIFRHFELQAHSSKEPLTFEQRLALITHAVAEVRFSVIASTIASLVVFIPLAFTSQLSYAILGDLAKAVVFSHGFSAIVALILVPTIRLHVMKRGFVHDKPSLLEMPLQRLEHLYSRALARFMEMPKVKFASFAALALLFAGLTGYVAPRLPREIIGKPDTEMLFFSISTSGNTMIRQMEGETEQIENELLQACGDKISYTFTQINRPNTSFILLRLNNKSDMKDLWKELENKFPDTPLMHFDIAPWNPAEMPIPNPPDFRLAIHGSDRQAMTDLSRDIQGELVERKIFNRVVADPPTDRTDTLRIRPRTEQWPALASAGVRLSLSSLADLTRVATEGETLTHLDLGGENMNIFVRYPENYIGNPNELGSLPIGAGGKILPLKAVADLSLEPSLPSIRRDDGRETYNINARGAAGETAKTRKAVEAAQDMIRNWDKLVAERNAKRAAEGGGTASTKTRTAPTVIDFTDSGPTTSPVSLQIVDTQLELNEALRQLAVAVSLSIALIFLTMVFQFGNIMNAALVLVSIPLGLIGVLSSLYIFHSTLSLNSLLGVILLNGISVANSIILVDFLQKKVREGVAPRLAAVEVARVRLRPILMTSLTTGLGMLPVALGFGEGGKILQPLGIAVAGGLGFSMITTLFIVPALQVAWLERSARRHGRELRT